MTWLNPMALTAMASLMLALPASPANAQAMIVRSSGPSAPQNPVGRKLPAGAMIVLGNGDLLTLLDAHGTRTIKGPGSFPASSAASTDESIGRSVATLLTAQRRSRARTGAVRSPGGVSAPARSPNLWYVDVSQSQTACTPDLANIVLWRPDIAAAATFHVAAASGPSKALVEMPQGQATTGWPAALPPRDGAKFTVARTETETISLTLVKIDTPPADAQALADVLIAHGCMAQLDLLLDTVPAR